MESVENKEMTTYLHIWKIMSRVTANKFIFKDGQSMKGFATSGPVITYLELFGSRRVHLVLFYFFDNPGVPGPPLCCDSMLLKIKQNLCKSWVDLEGGTGDLGPPEK